MRKEEGLCLVGVHEDFVASSNLQLPIPDHAGLWPERLDGLSCGLIMGYLLYAKHFDLESTQQPWLLPCFLGETMRSSPVVST